MYERFTDRARRVMQFANQEAQRLNHEYIGTEHILLGLVKEGSGVAVNVLRNLNVEPRKVIILIERLIQRGPGPVEEEDLPKTPRTKKVIEYAMEEACSLKHKYVGTEHILVGLLREAEGVAAQVLMNCGLTLEAVRNEVVALLGSAKGEESGSGTPPPDPSYMSSRLADETRQLLRDAAEKARISQHKTICTGYLLLELLHASGTAASRALQRSEIAAETIREKLSEHCADLSLCRAGAAFSYNPAVTLVIRAAAEEAEARSPFREIEQKVKAVEEQKFDAIADQDFENAARLRDKERELRKSLPERAWMIGVDHLLLGVLRIPECEAVRIIEAAGATAEVVRTALLQEIEAGQS